MAGSWAQQLPVQGPRLGYALARAVNRSGTRPNIMYKQKEGRAVNRKHSEKEESRPIYVDLVYTIRSSPRLGPEV